MYKTGAIDAGANSAKMNALASLRASNQKRRDNATPSTGRFETKSKGDNFFLTQIINDNA